MSSRLLGALSASQSTCFHMQRFLVPVLLSVPSRTVLEQNADLFATDRGDVSNALKSAGLGANVDIFKKLHQRLKDKVDLNDQKNDRQGETILIVASSNGRDDIVEYLLENGANPNLVTTIKDSKDAAYDQDARTFACQRGHAGVIKLLLKHGAVNHRTGKAACDY